MNTQIDEWRLPGSFQGKIRINFKIWYEYEDDGEWHPLLGEKKIELLKALRKMNSLNMAAKELQIDYKKAWDMLHNMNSCEFCKKHGLKLVTREQNRGRKSGTQLSTIGEILVEVYEDIEQRILKQVSRINKEYFQT